MEEKKLTDEEIVTIFCRCLDGSANGCANCYYCISESRCNMKQLNRDILDLIHRLQSENAELSKKYDKASEYSLKLFQENNEQKAEIERLKGFLQTFKTVSKEKDEQIEKSVEEVYADFMKEYKLTRQDIKESLEREAELQKQVDELSENLEKAYATERDNIRAEIANAGTSCHWCLQQAVKDTVKEILRIVKEKDYDYLWSLERVIKDRYGVEVE